jgi:hypothetical protein
VQVIVKPSDGYEFKPTTRGDAPVASFDVVKVFGTPEAVAVSAHFIVTDSRDKAAVERTPEMLRQMPGYQEGQPPAETKA